ncbi:MAG TPA: penicillin-binding transpeptidase domain-containing protein [Feifaniaceae bacterium]|nr:penicillin-binding transpeptidase domain-containing protein [Feifaniaceae bacterium]
MKNKPKGRFAILALAIAVMMVALIMQLGSLTLAEGETYAKSAANLSTSTVYTTGARGRILDRNGIPLAYDSTSYNVQFYRDPERTSEADTALYTESLLEAISIIEQGGGTIIDTSYIRMDDNGEMEYDWGVETEKAVMARYKNFCNVMGFTIKKEYENDMSKWISAEEAYRKLRKAWKIPEELPFSEAVKIISIRQEVNLNKWRAYEPVTVAFNVPMEVVAQLDMKKGELLGIQTVQSTSRVYPWGTTAAHILGYLGRQVTNEMAEDGMARMGYVPEDYSGIKDIFGTNDDTQTVVDMTRMGYSYNDYIGVAGIEKTMEKYLTANTSKQRGTQTIEKNKSGTITRSLEKTPASNGDDVMLTIDLPLQTVTEAALKNAIEKIRIYEEQLLIENRDDYLKDRSDLSTIKMAETGSIVVLDIHTGKVLAMASYPSFDPNMFIAGLSTDDAEALFGETSGMPTLNRAIASRLAPGSIFKMATGLAGLMEGEITTSTEISDQGPYILYENGVAITRNAPHCWAKSARELAEHQDLNLSEALTKSCNYFFCTVAEKLGIERLNDWSTKLGLSTPTGIELPGELTSHVGGQGVLYDNKIPISQQKSSLPNYVYNKLQSYLKEILTRRTMEVDEAAVKSCAQKLIELQAGVSDTQFGPDIRRILNEELGLPIGITQQQNWVNEISSMLTELQWKPTMTIRAGFGQASTLTTPVAIARYAATYGNGGTVYDVHIVDRILDESGSVVKLYEPTVYNKIDAPDEYWQAIRDGLKGVVSPEDHGTAASAFTEEFRDEETGYLNQIIGKSGTAQISASGNVDIENTGWFVTLLPRDNPEIVIVTCLPYGQSGSRAGGPAVEDITRFYLDRKTGSAKDNLVAVNGLVP